MALEWLRKEPGVVGWAASLVAGAGWIVAGGVPLLGALLFFLATVAIGVCLPGLALLLLLYWRGPAGRIRQPRRAFWAVVGLLVAYAILWLTVLPTGFGDVPEIVALYVPDVVVLLALAERAEAYGKRGWTEALLGAVGAYTAMLPFFDTGLRMVGLSFALGIAVLVALQALPLRTATRVVVALGIVPVSWGLPDVIASWELRIATEALLVLGYAVGLALLWRRLPKAAAAAPPGRPPAQAGSM